MWGSGSVRKLNRCIWNLCDWCSCMWVFLFKKNLDILVFHVYSCESLHRHWSLLEAIAQVSSFDVIIAADHCSAAHLSSCKRSSECTSSSCMIPQIESLPGQCTLCSVQCTIYNHHVALILVRSAYNKYVF